MTTEISTLQNDAIELLKKMIKTPSLSKEEDGTANLIIDFLKNKSIEKIKRRNNNIWIYNKYFDKTKKTILLNSHHDTVKPNQGYTYPPFEPTLIDDKLIGLGSNDAGASLVSLISTFVYFYNQKNLPFNLCLAATAEEEISGDNSIRSILDDIIYDCAIVGEPTQMKIAKAEKGLIVLRLKAKGKSGHAARDIGENALYKAIEDISWFKSYDFDKVSPALGKVKMSVTMIQSGYQHNVIPDLCKFTVDIRNTDMYNNMEIIEIVKSNIKSEIGEASSYNLNSSSIAEEHPFIQNAIKLEIETFGSPTLSDQAQIPKPSIKMGPGMSERSHTPDEYIYISEIKDGVNKYIEFLENLDSTF